MQFFTEISKSNIEDFIRGYNVIVCKIRNSRLKAKQLAILETLFLQKDNDVLFVKNGPLGDIKGIFSFLCPVKNLAAFKDKLKFAGYCDAFYLLDFESTTSENDTELISINPLIWKGKAFSIRSFFIQEQEIYDAQSPHNREFKLATDNSLDDACGSAIIENAVKTIRGYRGDGSELGKRALPVEDARCMVNLSLPWKNCRAIDPFAGGGGIVYQFKYIAPESDITSIDIDPVLKPGLEHYGANHFVMNARDAAFPENYFDSIVTEVPFSTQATEEIAAAFKNLERSLSGNGIYVIMCEQSQSGEIHSTLEMLGNSILFDHKIDRKGMDVEIQVWCKSECIVKNFEEFIAVLRKIY
jgi:hypothetical protein